VTYGWRLGAGDGKWHEIAGTKPSFLFTIFWIMESALDIGDDFGWGFVWCSCYLLYLVLVPNYIGIYIYKYPVLGSRYPVPLKYRLDMRILAYRTAHIAMVYMYGYM
jgi:hypothetical protein